jgi:mono/diheme cytochrome c family protein
MYFGTVNTFSGEYNKSREGIFEDVHQWTLTIEAPSYPGTIDTALAEQGAILFHEKDLWANDQNADIPRPHGKGSCAGCHGAYSPRYANDLRFLPDPRLIGTTGYTVPIEIVGTDPAQATGWAKEIRPHVSTFWWAYPDAVQGYTLPEEKDPLTELLDDYALTDGISGANVADHLRRSSQGMGALQPVVDALANSPLVKAGAALPGLPLAKQLGRVKGACGFEEKTVGYVTPPLHGVWASAPYFHNGSVPSVWDVLKPAHRPAMWRRQMTPNGITTGPDRGFEHDLASAYDFQNLGWKYDELACDDGGRGIPYYSCEPATPMPAEIRWVRDAAIGGTLWPIYGQIPPINQQTVEDRKIYNTNLYSKKNTGHEWTKVLTDAERRALIEYLKTL